MIDRGLESDSAPYKLTMRILFFIFEGFSDISKKGDLSFFSKTPPSLCISRLLIELQSSSKNQKNPHGQLIWGGITFQTSIYHSFPLKPGCVKKYPHHSDSIDF